MKTKLPLLLSLILGVVFILSFSPVKASALSTSNFTNDLIDDSVFRNSSTMSPSSIETFLQNERSGIAYFQDVENCGSPSGPHYSFYQSYYKCGTSQLAAQIIFDASQAYGINPEAIIATLQKEQSLITTPNPTSSQLNYAMGYGCPDSGGCSFPGFFNQVDNGTWQFRVDMELGSGNSWWGYSPSSYPCINGTSFYSKGLLAGNTVTFYDGNGTPYNTITLTNMSTATLYCYTPHVYNNPQGLYGLPQYGTTGSYYSGSYNFVNYFTLWFGSTTGELLRSPDNGQVYITNYSNGYKYPINSLNVLNDYSTLGIDYVSDAYLNGFTTGTVVGNMAQGPDGTLYLVNAGIKLPFSSCSGDVVDYGFSCASNGFIPLTEGQANKLASGPGVTKLVQSNNNATVYYMSSGTKLPIPGWGDLLSLHIPISINVLTSAFVNQYTSGPTLYGSGSLTKTAESSTVYVVKDSSTLLPISSFIFPQELGLSPTLRTMSDADFQNRYNSAQSAVNLTNMVQCSSNNYIATNGSLYQVTNAMATNYGFNLANFKDIGNLCTEVTINSQPLSQYIRTSDGTIYYVSSGQKHAFTSYSTYQSASYCNNTCYYTQASNYLVNSIPSGSNL